MQNIIDLLNSFGLNINITGNINPLVYIAVAFLIFNLIVLLSVVNISIYLISLYIINTNKYIDTISSKYPYILKIIKYYNSTRVSFIFLELVFLFGSIGYMIYGSVKLLIILS
uniref:hypothetical protein n=1 Tax=Daedalea confragosa TaxID=2028083 RepID=UPI002A81F76A|nr:hypothetical protein UYH48_mgp45 [Daedaleopsis confragosa]WNZ34377.1 hypothetical protein [Daedaleopsis confragosa]